VPYSKSMFSLLHGYPQSRPPLLSWPRPRTVQASGTNCRRCKDVIRPPNFSPCISAVVPISCNPPPPLPHLNSSLLITNNDYFSVPQWRNFTIWLNVQSPHVCGICQLNLQNCCENTDTGHDGVSLKWKRRSGYLVNRRCPFNIKDLRSTVYS
jgi:hypothetical protein